MNENIVGFVVQNNAFIEYLSQNFINISLLHEINELVTGCVCMYMYYTNNNGINIQTVIWRCAGDRAK